MIHLYYDDLHKKPAIDTLKSLHKIISLNKVEPPSFIQIGVSDGINHDIAKDVLDSKDIGIFIEPIEKAFNLMKINKSEFTNSTFLKKAVVPECLKYNNTMNLLDNDDIGQGSSFGKFNKHRINNNIQVDTITVFNLLDTFNIQSLDFFFCDAESIDHLIVSDLLTKITPEVIFFETCWWCGSDTELEISDDMKIIVPSRSKMKQLLASYGYKVIDFLEDNSAEKREDILAIQYKYVNKI